MFRTLLQTPIIVTAALITFAITTSHPSEALKIGNWEGICMARNAVTGEMQQVEESHIARRPFPPWFGRTRRNEDGSWLIEFNVLAMNVYKVSDDMKKFIFYHECAHARLNEGSERIADCEGLRHMREDMAVSQEMINGIAHTYLLISRKFPTGGPCEEIAPPQQATVR